MHKRSFSRFGVKLWNKIPCSLRNLAKKEFKREIRRLLLDILVKENDHIETLIIWVWPNRVMETACFDANVQ